MLQIMVSVLYCLIVCQLAQWICPKNFIEAWKAVLSIIEKEGLACINDVKRFHFYLFGHKFVLQTDHQPLTTLFNMKGKLYLFKHPAGYNDEHYQCRLNQLPLPNQPSSTHFPSELVLLIESLDHAPITANRIAAWTKRDLVLSTVMQYLMIGWPSAREKPYWNRRLE